MNHPHQIDTDSNIAKDIVVIGAGISGLTCAYRLKQLGYNVALLERSERAGGVIRSERVNGYLIERGPNSSQGTEELLALVEELGIGDELIEGDPKLPAYVYFDSRLHAVPAGPSAFLSSKLLSPRGKLRILSEVFVPRRRSDEEESVASFVRRRIGSEAAERLVAPFVSGIYAGDSNALSVQAAFPRLANLESGYGGLFRGMMAKAREAKRQKKSAAAVMDKAAPTRKRLVSFRDGMAVLPETLARHLGENFLSGCERIAVTPMREQRLETPEPGAVCFTVEFQKSNTTYSITCKRLVIATPAGAAAALVDPVSNDLSRLLSEIDYPPLAIVYLAYPPDAIRFSLAGFGFLVAPSERLNILGCVWNTSLFAGRAPEDRALLTSFIGGARHPERARLSDDELVATVHADLQAAMEIVVAPRVVGITRWERAIPQYNLGHAQRVRQMESLTREIPGLHLVGNYLHGVSTGDCVKEADRVAREIAAELLAES